jgi:hypothetical protein
MRCANPKCNKPFSPFSTKHLYCKPKCNREHREDVREEEERARFLDAPAFPISAELQLQLAERHSEDERLSLLIDVYKPDGARFVRFGCPKVDREIDPDFDFMLRWFPARGYADLQERHGDPVRLCLNVPAIPLPRKAYYVLAYFDTSYRLIEPWKYKIYIDFCHPDAPWYAGDKSLNLKR